VDLPVAEVVVTENRMVSIAERDRELDALLISALDRLEGRAQRSTEPLFAPILRYGATLDLDAEYADVEALAPYLPSEVRSPPSQASIRPESQQLDEAQHADYFEYAQPGGDWSERHKALFWRVLARLHEKRFSDAFLNLTARALANAIPWHVANDPSTAVELLLWRARALSYASYGDKDVLPCIDEAVRIWPALTARPEHEYAMIVQACEALDRSRVPHMTSPPRSRELLTLATRGLHLASSLGEAPQVSRVHNAAADALVNADDAAIDADARRVFIAHYGAGSRLAWAAAAWRRALELEDGDFYGEKTASRRAERIARYERELALLALIDGRARDAVDALVAIAPADNLYGRLQAAKLTVRLLAARGASRGDRAEYLRRRLERDTPEADAKTEFDQEMVADYVAFAAYQFENVGAGDEARSLVASIRARSGVAAADERRRESDEASKQRTNDDVKRLLSALFDRKQAEITPEERARRLDAMRRAETPERRAYRVVDELVGDVTAERRLSLLVAAFTEVREAGRQVAVTLEVNCNEAAIERVVSDPVVRDAIATIDAGVRAGLDPSTAVTVRVVAVPVEQLVGEAGGTTRALTLAGATSALAALGWNAADGDDTDHDRVMQAQRDARTKLRVGGWI
jgi:hypothetical protein